MPAPPVSGVQCIHTDWRGTRCVRPSKMDGPHGWLCEMHDAIVTKKAEKKIDTSALPVSLWDKEVL